MKSYKHSALRAYINENLDRSKPKLYNTEQLERYYLAGKQDESPLCTLSGPDDKSKSISILQAIDSYDKGAKTALIVCENGDNVKIFQDILKRVLKSDFAALETRGAKCEHEIDCLFIDHADYVENLQHACVDLKNLSTMNIKVVMACHTTIAESIAHRLGVTANIQYKNEFKAPKSYLQAAADDAKKKSKAASKKEEKNKGTDKDTNKRIDIDKTYSVVVPTPARLVELKKHLATTFEYYTSTQFVDSYVLGALFEIMETLPELCDSDPRKYAAKMRGLSLEIDDQNGASNPSLAAILDMDVLTAATKIAMSRFECDKKKPAESDVYVLANGTDVILVPKGEWFEKYMRGEATQERNMTGLKDHFALLAYDDKNAVGISTNTSIRCATWENAVREANIEISKGKGIEDDAIVLHVGDFDNIKRHLTEISMLDGKADESGERGPGNRTVLDTIILSMAAEYTSVNKGPNHAKANAFEEYAQETGLCQAGVYGPDTSRELIESLQNEFAARCEIPGSRANAIYEKHKKNAKSYGVDFTDPETVKRAFGLVRDVPGIQPLYRD